MRISSPIVVVALVLALPVLLPCAFVRHWISQRRLRNAAQSLPCPSCGRPLGIEALRAAEERWRAHAAELRRANPGVRLRLVRQLHAMCTACGARLQFREESRTFVGG